MDVRALPFGSYNIKSFLLRSGVRRSFFQEPKNLNDLDRVEAHLYNFCSIFDYCLHASFCWWANAKCKKERGSIIKENFIMGIFPFMEFINSRVKLIPISRFQYKLFMCSCFYTVSSCANSSQGDILNRHSQNTQAALFWGTNSCSHTYDIPTETATHSRI